MFDFDRFNALVSSTGVKKSAIAARLGRQRSLFNDWERKNYTPSESAIAVIAEMLGTTPEYLTGQTDQKEKQPAQLGELSAEEQEIISALRSADPALRRAALSVLKSAEPQAPVQNENGAKK